jgi:hypothetical protein
MGIRTDGLGIATLLSLGISAADIPVTPAMPTIPSLPAAVSKQYQKDYRDFRMDASCSRWNIAIAKGQTFKSLFPSNSPDSRMFVLALEQMRVNQQYNYMPTVGTVGCVPDVIYSPNRTNSQPTDFKDWNQIIKPTW